jgi:hypothetical protein
MKDALPADDGAVKEKPKSKKRKRITEKDHKKAKANLLKELNSLANDAIDRKDHKLVYSIERAIESLEEED